MYGFGYYCLDLDLAQKIGLNIKKRSQKDRLLGMKVPSEYRVRKGQMGSDDSYGNNGMFIIPYHSYEFTVVASDGEGWEHVSVSLKNRCPNWGEMSYIKSLFWSVTECVVEFHPPASEYVNNHENCLHMWKQVGKEWTMPPSILVGIKGLEIQA